MTGDLQVQATAPCAPGVESEPSPGPDLEGAGIDQLKTQFLASLNHEIRTPLSGIIGMTDLLYETPLTEEQREYVASARICAENLLELLTTTLEYSALTAGTLVLDHYEFNLAEALELAVAEHITKARQKGLSLLFSFDDSLPATVIGDARRIRQLISHLIGNAIKFTARGRVRVAAAHASPGVMSVTVEDTGIGIEPDKLELIFESFRQLETGLARPYSGLGLGLALAKKIALLIGGDITVESQPGSGSRFTALLPLTTPAPAIPHPLHEPSTPGLKKSILVMEDNRIAQTVITHVLRRNQFRVKCVGSGTEGLEAASRERFDLILMDLQMPEMDGMEATERVRQLPEYQSVPIIALTASHSDQYREVCERKGMQGFLSKPVQPGELIANVRRFV